MYNNDKRIDFQKTTYLIKSLFKLVQITFLYFHASDKIISLCRKPDVQAIEIYIASRFSFLHLTLIKYSYV